MSDFHFMSGLSIVISVCNIGEAELVTQAHVKQQTNSVRIASMPAWRACQGPAPAEAGE